MVERGVERDRGTMRGKRRGLGGWKEMKRPVKGQERARRDGVPHRNAPAREANPPPLATPPRVAWSFSFRRV